MTHEQRKISKIVSELTIFLFSIGADDINTNIKVTSTATIIDIHSNYNIQDEHMLNKPLELLHSPRDEALEEQYWELAGSGDVWETTQVLLVGVMTDKVTTTYENGKVHFNLVRNK